eukprot:gene21224-22038_t
MFCIPKYLETTSKITEIVVDLSSRSATSAVQRPRPAWIPPARRAGDCASGRNAWHIGGPDMTVLLRLAALAATAIVPLSGALASEPGTTTPIKHVIVVIGENVSFDTLFATYTPKAGQSVKNLLSQGIVKADGTPGRSFSLARQNIGSLLKSAGPNPGPKYSINPMRVGPYATLPQPLMIGVLDPPDFSFAPGVPHPRYSSTMPAGPYQITNSQVHYSGTFQNEFSYETGDP